MFLALALALTSILALPPQSPPAETCREAYVEAWFQETAEADLEAALRSYGRCITLGEEADRELVARALWRMGMIARAREEREVAEEYFGKVLAEYDGTKAAERVREVMAAPVVADSAESEAVAEARRILREMLLDGASATTAQLTYVLRNLTARQIEDECRQQGGTLRGVLQSRGEFVIGTHAEDYAELALVADPSTARTVINVLRYHDEGPLRAPIIELAHGASADVDEALFGYLIHRPEDEAMNALLAVVERSPEVIDWVSRKGVGIDDLLRNPRPVAGEVFGRMVATVPDTPEWRQSLGQRLEKIGNQKQGFALLQRTPAGDRLRELFPTLPTVWRDKLARQALRQDPAREVIDLLLADRDPAVRRSGLLALLHADDPAWRLESLERLKRESIDVQLTVLETACRKIAPVLPLDALLQLEPGVAREFVYLRTLRCGDPAYASEGRSITDVLRAGLDRGDPELLHAVFAPSSELSRIRRTQSPLSGIVIALQNDLPVARGRSLAERLTTAALNAPQEAVQLRAPDFARGLLPADVLTRCLEPALRSSSASLRRAALEARPRGIAEETLVQLLQDPNHRIFTTTLGLIEPGPEVLLPALEKLSDERRLQVLLYAQSRNYLAVVRAIYLEATSPQARESARKAFGYLKTRDADLLIEALSHQDPSIQRSSAEQLARLELPDWDAFLWIGPGGTSGMDRSGESQKEQNQSNLRARRAEVAEALQRWNVERLTQRMTQGNQDTPAQVALAGELAALGDRDRLLEYALRDGGWMGVGGRGLVLLEDRETMRHALRESYYPAGLLPWALELDLVDTLFGLERAGRLDTWDLISKLIETNRHADLARLLLGDDGPFLDRTLDARTVSLIVDAAATLDDPVLLSRAAARLDSPSAVKALFEQGELALILTHLQDWGPQARYAARAEIARRCGEEPAKWPEYLTEQEALIESWRVKLGVEEREAR